MRDMDALPVGVLGDLQAAESEHAEVALARVWHLEAVASRAPQPVGQLGEARVTQAAHTGRLVGHRHDRRGAQLHRQRQADVEGVVGHVRAVGQLQHRPALVLLQVGGEVGGAGPPRLTFPIGTPLEEIERTVIRETLGYTKGDKRLTAQLLGIATRTIYRKLDKTETGGGGPQAAELSDDEEE